VLEIDNGEGGLWYHVLKARYGEVGVRIREGGRNSSVWWRMLCRIREGVGEGIGLKKTLGVSLGMVEILCFGMTGGLETCHWGWSFPAFLIWRWKRSARWERWRVAVGESTEGPGCGDVVCLRGKRSLWGSVVCYYIILFCRTLFMIGGGGLSTLFMVTQFGEHTVFSLL